jgi:type IV secretion system protein VirB4
MLLPNGLNWFGGNAPTEFSDTLNWSSLLEPGVLGCKDGSFVAAWSVSGLDTESLEPEAFQAHLDRLASGFGGFGDSDCFWILLDRKPFAGLKAQETHVKYPALDLLELEARATLSSSGAVFENAIHLVYQYQPYDVNAEAARNLKEFAQQCKQVETRLGSVLSLRRLGRKTEDTLDQNTHHFDELLGLLAGTLTGRARRVRVPADLEYQFLDKLLGIEFTQHKLSELPFVDGRPTAIMTVDGFPSELPRGALEIIETMGFEFRWTARISPFSTDTARKEAETAEKEWLQNAADVKAQVNDGGGGKRNRHADDMARSADEMVTDVNRGTAHGTYLSTLIIYGPPGASSDVLSRGIENVTSFMLDAGFDIRVETEGALEMYLACLPGHAHRGIREVLISIRDSVELIPVRTSWKGEKFNPSRLLPAKSPSLMFARSMTGELFHFNLHVDETGHALVLGPTRGGKSVLLGSVAANFLKYRDARVIFFDKGSSSRHMCNAFGGQFTNFGGEKGRGIAPMSHLPELGLEWGVKWISEMARRSGITMTPALFEEIRDGLTNALETGFLTLSGLKTFVQNSELQAAIGRFSKEGGSGLLDDDESPLEWANMTVFETHDLFDMDEDTAVLALDYIFAQVQRRFDGTPTLLIIDEAHAFLLHELFADRIRMWVKEGGKYNVAVVLATQELGDIRKSKIKDVLLGNCKTRIFLPNPVARSEDVRGDYRALGVNSTQVDLIASLTPKQDYYLVKPNGQRVVEFLFGPVALSLLGKTTAEESKRAGRLYSENPDYWKDEVSEIIARQYEAGAMK